MEDIRILDACCGIFVVSQDNYEILKIGDEVRL